FSQEPDPSIQRAMVRAKERQKCRRVYVIVHHGRILPIQDIVHAYARGPAISMKRELSFHRGIQRKELRKAELSRPGNDLPKLVNGHKAEAGAPYAGPCHIKLLELPWQRITAPGLQLVWRIPWQHSAHLITHRQFFCGKDH